MKAVKGVYKNGKITLKEKLRERGPFEVVVVFPEPSDDPWEKILSEKKPRSAFVKFAEECINEIRKGNAKPLRIDDL